MVREVGDCIATVTDGHGQIIAVWSDSQLREDADNSNLEPSFCWAEAIAGTNGMGMALVLNGIVAVRGPEHWRADMHEWNCLGAAVSDPVLGEAAAALNISSRSEETVMMLAHRLREELAAARQHLASQAARDAATVRRACARAEHHRSDIVIGLDLGGAILAGGQEVQRRIGGTIEPMKALRSVARDGLAAMMAGSSWRTTFAPGPPLALAEEQFEVRLVEGPAGPAGWLLSTADHPVEVSTPTNTPAARGTERPDRVAAEFERCVLLLSPDEIRFAEARGHAVWLVTDRGRLRALTRGIDNVERQLADHGFLRVHRSFLVNPDRVQRIDQKGNGVIALSTHLGRPEDIPVSRRSTPAVRQALGLDSVSLTGRRRVP
ncbi:MAG: hypothetical protein ABS81_27105 [Pseudonocardia sp. SCN 72-86]|nr:MAG: hypothetical protein ABS81_27105 [Pseudonocardia sp. SCN 72-86]